MKTTLSPLSEILKKRQEIRQLKRQLELKQKKEIERIEKAHLTLIVNNTIH